MTEQTSLNLSSIEITAGRAIDQLLHVRSPKITALPDFVKRDISNHSLAAALNRNEEDEEKQEEERELTAA